MTQVQGDLSNGDSSPGSEKPIDREGAQATKQAIGVTVLDTRNKVSPLILVSCLALFAVGAALFTDLVIAAMGGETGPGAFLMDGLSWAAFLVPAYPWMGALIVAMPGFRLDLLFALVASLAPFASIALTARLLDDPVEAFRIYPGLKAIGANGMAAVGFGVTLILVASLTALASRFGRPAALAADTADDGSEDLPDYEPRVLELSLPDNPKMPFAGQVETLQSQGDAVSARLDQASPPASVPVEDLEIVEDFEDGSVEPGDDEAPIPLMFKRPATTVPLESRDPALDADYWSDDNSVGEDGSEDDGGLADDGAEMIPRPSLLPRVETFFDGEHEQAVRDGTVAGKAAPAGRAVTLLPAKRPGRKPVVKYALPIEGILTAYPDGQYWIIDDKTRHAAEVLRETLKEFGIAAEVTGIRKGPVITMFEILPAPGVRLSKIANLCDNIALRLAASSVRIVAPIPGKHAVGIEVPNERRSIVSFREIVENEVFKNAKMEVPVVLGKDITGDVQVVELTQTPHLLIAGATGSGKSVCVNSIILSILYKRSFNEVKLILIDPKIVELKLYNGIPHLLTPVITEPKRAFQALQYCICEMERRYSLLDAMGVRDIKSYNRKIVEKVMATDKLPYIVVVIDEFADLMATTGKELESTLARLAAMSRAVGIHLVLATQRPSIDVITGLIKANIPSRIAFMVASKFDSRIIIDMVGAEKLLGRGDMLYSSATDAFPVRMQGAFVSEDEVERVVAYVKTLGEPDYIDDEIFVDDEEDEGPSLFDEEDDDPLYEKALEIVLSQGKASASFLQRKLKIGYNRAARLVELMEEKGIVGKAQGSKPRDLMHNPEMGRVPNPRARYVPDFTPEEDAAEQTEGDADGDEA